MHDREFRRFLRLFHTFKSQKLHEFNEELWTGWNWYHLWYLYYLWKCQTNKVHNTYLWIIRLFLKIFKHCEAKIHSTLILRKERKLVYEYFTTFGKEKEFIMVFVSFFAAWRRFFHENWWAATVLKDYAFSFFLQTKMWWSERYDDVARQLEIAIALLLSRVFDMCLEATMQHFVMWDCGTKRFFNWSFKYLNSSPISANSWRKVTCESFDKRKIHIAVLHIRFI